MTYAVKRVKPWHIKYIARNCREQDRKEIYLQSMLKPFDAIDAAVENSVACWVGTFRSEPIVIFGVCRESLLGDMGVPWLIGTPEIENHQVAFLRHSRKYFVRMAKAFPRLENYVWVGNKSAIQWLKWLGFNMDPPARHGLGQAEFMKFWFNRKDS